MSDFKTGFLTNFLVLAWSLDQYKKDALKNFQNLSTGAWIMNYLNFQINLMNFVFFFVFHNLVHSPPFQVFFKSHTKREPTQQRSPKIGVLKLVSQDLPTIHMSPFCSSKETFLKTNQHSRKICMLPQSKYLINVTPLPVFPV